MITLIPERWQSKVALTATIALTMIIAVLTLSPSNSVPSVGNQDKLYHFVAFAALIFPIAFLQPNKLGPLAIGLAIFYGGAIEVIQPSVGRTMSFLDFVADAFGVGGGVLAARLLHRMGLG